MYLTVVIDWYSRYVLAWRLSNTLDGRFCEETLEQALEQGNPEIFNTDQGVQYTAQSYLDRLEKAGVKISMTGKGRAFDNIFVARLWRSVKYECIYIQQYERVIDLERGLSAYFNFYNTERYHENLDYRRPAQVHFSDRDLS